MYYTDTNTATDTWLTSILIPILPYRYRNYLSVSVRYSVSVEQYSTQNIISIVRGDYSRGLNANANSSIC